MAFLAPSRGPRPAPATWWMRRRTKGLKPAILVASAGHGQHLPARQGQGGRDAPPSYARAHRARPFRCPDAARRPSSPARKCDPSKLEGGDMELDQGKSQ
uniref:Uncharacterized protein n=1 Tax=Oryza glumipatula TaxID=40148 RepID=A0A0D9Y3K8_9ORYZ